jgi:hypothetical protein
MLGSAGWILWLQCEAIGSKGHEKVFYSVATNQNTRFVRFRTIVYRSADLIIQTAAALGNGLPAQERISLTSNDIPDVRGIARAGIGNCNYVPACTCWLHPLPPLAVSLASSV